MEQNKLRQKILEYKVLQNRVETLHKQLNLILNKIEELEITENGLKELENANELNFSLGNQVFIKGKIVDKQKVLVGMGANIFMEKTFEEAIKIIEKRKKELKEAVQHIQQEVSNILSVLQQLEKEISEVSKNV